MKKAFLTTFPITLIFCIMLALSLKDPFPAKREFNISYHAKMDNLPSKAKKIRIWIPLASSRDGQEILSRRVTPKPDRIDKETLYGNEMAYFDFVQPFPPRIEMRVDYCVRVVKDDFQHQANEERRLPLYLKPSKLMSVDERVRERTFAAVQNRSTLWDKAKVIYENVISSMSYDKTMPGWGRGDTRRACLLGKGNCTDFHSLFISMAHAAEIPARFKIGLTIPEQGQGEIPGYHCWAEFYEEGKGWKPVDAAEAWKHPERKEAYFGKFDTNKFLISVGRDIDLVPKQAGPPVNIFFYPYVEVNGKEWEGGKTSFQFKNLKN